MVSGGDCGRVGIDVESEGQGKDGGGRKKGC